MQNGNGGLTGPDGLPLGNGGENERPEPTIRTAEADHFITITHHIPKSSEQINRLRMALRPGQKLPATASVITVETRIEIIAGDGFLSDVDGIRDVSSLAMESFQHTSEESTENPHPTVPASIEALLQDMRERLDSGYRRKLRVRIDPHEGGIIYDGELDPAEGA